jgi:hypothetical protein
LSLDGFHLRVGGRPEAFGFGELLAEPGQFLLRVVDGWRGGVAGEDEIAGMEQCGEMTVGPPGVTFSGR